MSETTTTTVQDDLPHNSVNVGLKEGDNFLFIYSHSIGTKGYKIFQEALKANRDRWEDPPILNAAVFEAFVGGKSVESTLTGIGFYPNYDRDHAMFVLDHDLKQVVLVDGPQRRLFNFEEFIATPLEELEAMATKWVKSDRDGSWDWFENIEESKVNWKNLVDSMASTG